MSQAFTLKAQVRSDKGKGASRRLRRTTGEIPAILYGGSQDATPLALPHKELKKALENEAFYTSVVTLELDGGNEKAILKDLQRHPAREDIMHADFQRVDENTVVTVNVPVHFLNEDSCVGVKKQGGSIQHLLNNVEVTGPATKLPEFLEVDLADAEAGNVVHLTDLTLPEGVVVTALQAGEDHDTGVVIVNPPRGGAAEEEEAEEGGEE